jgi:hypothetical protein
VEDARHPLGVLPLTVSADGSDATLALRVDVKPTTDHWIIEAESTWLTADGEVFEEPIVKAAEDADGNPSTRVVSCTFLLSYVFSPVSYYDDTPVIILAVVVSGDRLCRLTAALVLLWPRRSS